MIISIISIAVMSYLGLAAVLFVRQTSFTFYPIDEVSYNPANLGLDYQQVQLKTADGFNIDSWYVPAENAEFTFLFCHGNGGNISHRLDSIEIFNALGVNCMIFDYRGYGNSEGKPDEDGLYIDAQTAYNWLVEHKKIGPDKIIIFGRSLGGTVAANLAAEVKPAGVIIESGFTSYYDMAHKLYPYLWVKPFLKYDFNTIEKIKNINAPVLVIHSRADKLVPFDFGLRLYNAANEPKEFIEIFGDHNDGFLSSGKIYKQGLAKWINGISKHDKAALTTN